MTHSSGFGVVSIGAYDRFNYGDLLFPLVLDFAARELGYPDLTHIAPQRSDLSPVGAVPTRSISDVYDGRTSRPTGVVLGGGEILGAPWGQAAATITPVPFDIPLLALRKLSSRAYDAVGRLLLSGSWPTPYVPSADSVRGMPLALNAIGASSLAVLDERTRSRVAESLRLASYASVRDSAGHAQLARIGVQSELAPDSVAILARLHPAAPPRADDEVMVVQASRAWMRTHRRAFSDALRTVAPRFGRVELLPIGLAGAHADREALESVRGDLAAYGVTATVVEPTTVWTIADAIAGASIFVGTSLHGAITSMAYGTPFVPLSGIGKLGAYLESWGGEVSATPVAATDLADGVARALRVPHDARLAHSGELERLSWSNTERVLNAAYAGR